MTVLQMDYHSIVRGINNDDQLSIEDVSEGTLTAENLLMVGNFPGYKSPPNPEELMLIEEQSLVLDAALKMLAPIEEAIIRAYFFEELGLANIGKGLNLSKERVRQIKERSIRRLRHIHEGSILPRYMRDQAESLDSGIGSENKELGDYINKLPFTITRYKEEFPDLPQKNQYPKNWMVKATTLPNECGDIYFHNDRYYIGQKETFCSGRLNSVSGIALVYFLTEIDNEIPEAKLREIIGTPHPLHSLRGLQCQLGQSKLYSLEFRRKCAKLIGWPSLPHERNYYLRRLK